MKYMGSKRRLVKYLLPIILKDRRPDQWYVEPFMGGCNMLCEVSGNRIGNDLNHYMAAMWEALVYKGWEPPEFISEDFYDDIKVNKDLHPPELVGFAGVAVTFGSKWFSTYARNNRGVNYAMEGRRKLHLQIEKLKGVIFKSESYDALNIPDKSIIYCDPPYAKTAKYKDSFEHSAFWNWCRNMEGMGHDVFISEYAAPQDFECIWSMEMSTNMKAEKSIKSIERLFKLP